MTAEMSLAKDVGDDLSLKVPLENMDDALYAGTIYLGYPQGQPVKVIFDTGSEYLGVSSALCDDKSAGNYHFKVYDAGNNDFITKEETNRCPNS